MTRQITEGTAQRRIRAQHALNIWNTPVLWRIRGEDRTCHSIRDTRYPSRTPFALAKGSGILDHFRLVTNIIGAAENLGEGSISSVVSPIMSDLDGSVHHVISHESQNFVGRG
jgi:hypothetical protein